MITLTERMAQLPPARRKTVDERAQALIAEEMSLWDLPPARHNHRRTGGHHAEDHDDPLTSSVPSRKYAWQYAPPCR